jgi:hypothetical protein
MHVYVVKIKIMGEINVEDDVDCWFWRGRKKKMREWLLIPFSYLVTLARVLNRSLLVMGVQEERWGHGEKGK